MDRICPAGVILIFNLSYIHYLKSTGDELFSVLENIEQPALNEDYDKAVALVSDFEAQWEKVGVLYGAFLQHEEIDDIERAKRIAFSYLETSELAQYLAENENLKFQLKHIFETQRLSLKNIF
jgi:hypothetical protein